ncbi:hypothetical protein [uncultured Desulfosarcina sp.]|uniref:hypothetical protein n=1 Tax=uncultured Desulfosarcina sp. TaxID=218289 RepID=UPI0029C792FB|nr:hypothetical protein [uncultured Desulfosarcina sp.]
MRLFATVVMIGLLLFSPASPVCSQQPETDPPEPAENPAMASPLLNWAASTFELSAGYRTDNLKWSIAGNLQGQNPTVRSELKWSSVRIYQLNLSNRTVIKDRFYVRGNLNYGTVASGNNRDSDYDGDNRTLEFSRSTNSVDGNNVWDGSIGIGPRFTFFDDTLAISPLVGYAVSEQDLNIVDGYQALSSPTTPPVGPIANLDSRYETHWEGPWIGVDLMVSIPCKQGSFTRIGILFSGEMHWFDYDAEANWNLRDEYRHPISFTHEAEGCGYRVGAKMLFETQGRWGMHAGMNVQEMTTDSGLDRIFYADGSTGDTRLNEVRWRSFTFEAGVSYRF